jgi:hypothetical protein
VFGTAGFIVCQVDIIGNAIVIAISSPGLRAAGIFRGAGFVGTKIVAVEHPIPVGIRATGGFNRTGFARTGIHVIVETISIRVWAAFHFTGTTFVGAGIFTIQQTITIRVARGGAAIMVSPTRFVRAGIIAICDQISVGVRAAFSPPWSDFIRTTIGFVGPAITISIPLTGGRTTITFGWASLVGAGIANVGESIAIVIGAAFGSSRPFIVRT